MLYSPKHPPTITTLEELLDYVQDELAMIAQAESDALDVWLHPVAVAPAKPREGMILYADGTNFDPGLGKGTYEFNGTAWVRPDPDWTHIPWANSPLADVQFDWKVHELQAGIATTVKMNFTVASGLATNFSGSIDFFALISQDIDISVAGPVAFGRDQAGAFAAGATVHFYAIKKPDGTTAGIASLDPGGPTFPTGYTFQCYLFSVVLTGAAQLPSVLVRGDLVTYFDISTSNVLLAGGAVNATANTFVNTAAVVPNNNVRSVLYEAQMNGSAAASIVQGNIGVLSGANAGFVVANPADWNSTAFEFAQYSANIYYSITVAGGAFSIWVLGYRVQNGAR